MSTRPAPALSAAILCAAVSSVHAQAPHPLPATIVAAVGQPDAAPASFVSVTVALGALPWTMTGCVSRTAGVCFATRRLVLTEADRRELVTRVEAVSGLGRCEPEGFSPGDPAYSLAFPAASYEGHLPARAALIPERTVGPCAAPARLAWWIAQRFNR